MALARSTSGAPLPLPPAALRFMGEDDEKLIRIGDELAGLLVEHGMDGTARVLDVGCGYGRLALGILHATEYRGRYLGFDVLVRQIAWCRENITPVYPNFEFRSIDIRNERYNPQGSIDPAMTTFPVERGETDLCAVFSVFTHLYRPVVERYLAEIRRILRPDGIAVTTWLVFDAARLPAVASDAAAYPMRYALDEVTRYASEEDPLRAIAFEESLVREMIARAGLDLVRLERGSWAGEPSRVFQDLVVLRRPGTILERSVHELRRLLRRVRGDSPVIGRMADDAPASAAPPG